VNDTVITVVGNVVDSPRRVSLEHGAVTNFRMASTSRRFDNRTQEFVDGGTLWVDVECWNSLSSNVSGSISKGDPVVVIGTLTTHSWESENGRRSAPRIKATAVGPNLARGTAVFKRDRPARAVEPVDDTATGPLSPSDGTTEDEFSGPSEGLVRGRDYEPDDETLHHLNADDLAPEPVHA
jgi:single-strand DNA-binding protein